MGTTGTGTSVGRAAVVPEVSDVDPVALGSGVTLGVRLGSGVTLGVTVGVGVVSLGAAVVSGGAVSDGPDVVTAVCSFEGMGVGSADISACDSPMVGSVSDSMVDTM